VKEWEERQQICRKISQLEEGHSKNNIRIFGLEERKDELILQEP
jgi:hypothetical protein